MSEKIQVLQLARKGYKTAKIKKYGIILPNFRGYFYETKN